mmetsp:Transcript_20543/g.58390  ORF Transcript_20543/g.58390 Transcript_20543/m.58390 type:complete len:204 (+) Transcript_20543:1276-1887(+)
MEVLHDDHAEEYLRYGQNGFDRVILESEPLLLIFGAVDDDRLGIAVLEGRKLRDEDDDRQTVHVPDQRSLGKETHEFGQSEHGKTDLDDAAEKHGHEQGIDSLAWCKVTQWPAVIRQVRHNNCQGSGRTGDHARLATKDARDEGHPERRLQSAQRRHAGHDRKGDGLWNLHDGHRETGDHLVEQRARVFLVELKRIRRVRLEP